MKSTPTNQLELTPHGVVVCRATDMKEAALFAQSEAAGLIALSGHKAAADSDLSVAFWRSFTHIFLRELCHVPENQENELEIHPPETGELAGLILTAPPMRGAEYLSPEILCQLWLRLSAWTREQVQVAGGLGAFLEKHAPLWSRVGRVTLHLAENKGDNEFPFAFMATYASGLTTAGKVRQLPLGKALKEYSGTQNKSALIKLLSPLHSAAGQNPLIADLLESGDIFYPLAWTAAEAYAFLQGIPTCEDAGLLVRLPDWWKKRSRPQVAATIGEEKKSTLGIETMLDFHLDVVVDDQRLTRDEIDALLAGDDGLVLLRGHWVEVNRAQLQQALDHWKAIERQGGISFIEGMRMLAGAPADLVPEEELENQRKWAFTQPGTWLSETLTQLRNPDQGVAPGNLHATLRPYQVRGLNWLWFCARIGLGACLADDMGLGKTIQVLAALLRKKSEMPGAAPTLLIVPASLIGNWKSEIEKFASTLNVFIAHRSEAGAANLDAPRLDDIDLVIITYSMLTRLEWPAQINWSWVVIDEAQAIKNHATRQSKAVRALKAEARFALTGTPIENRLGDLWSLFDFLNPGLLGDAKQFRAFSKAIQSGGHYNYAPLRRLIAPYIMRRMKTDKTIIADLPDKTEVRVFCGLVKTQAQLYRQTVDSLQKEVKEKTDGIQRKGLILSYLMRFKQICNHPDQLTGQGDYASAHSAKFRRLEKLCEEIASRGEKVLVFTQFRELTDPLAACLTSVFRRRGLILHGGTAVKKRQQMVNQFQTEAGPPFFILSLKAGGSGLNLTAASHVIHFDRWWNPAVENQATDRAFRIGQKNNVLVHKFVTTGTLEEKIDALLSEKQQKADQILDESAEKSLTEMSNDELLDLVKLDLEKATANL